MESYNYSDLISQLSEIESNEFDSFRNTAIKYIRSNPERVRKKMENLTLRMNLFKKIIYETDLFYNDNQKVCDDFLNKIESHFKYMQKVEYTLNGVVYF